MSNYISRIFVRDAEQKLSSEFEGSVCVAESQSVVPAIVQVTRPVTRPHVLILAHLLPPTLLYSTLLLQHLLHLLLCPEVIKANRVITLYRTFTALNSLPLTTHFLLDVILN